VVDTGKMSPAIRSILRDSGYAVFRREGRFRQGDFPASDEGGGVALEERTEYLLTGGETAGYEVRVTGAFLSLPGPSGGARRTVVLVRRKIHSATRALLGDMGVEIVEW